jgi:16S rRNA (guanine966-N2)-methyltransferase
MRIVSGRFKSRALLSPSGKGTRPTSDRARQAIFNILEHAVWRPFILPENANVLDIFAGTGALGLEALSRGAADIIFIENDRAALEACRGNIDSFGVSAETRLIKADALRPPPLPADAAPRNLVFLDPPYGKGWGAAALTALAAKGWLAPDAVCVLEMSKKEPEETPAGFTLADTRTYGIAAVRFLIYRGGV